MAKKGKSISGKTISVLAADVTGASGADNAQSFSLARRQPFGLARVDVPVEKLGAEVQTFLDTMNTVVGTLPETVGGLRLDSLTLSVEISAKGSVSLLGTGGEIAGKGGMTFTLRR